MIFVEAVFLIAVACLLWVIACMVYYAAVVIHDVWKQHKRDRAERRMMRK